MDGEEGGDQIRWEEGVVFDGGKGEGSLTSEKIEGVRMEGSREGGGGQTRVVGLVGGGMVGHSAKGGEEEVGL